ncbi:hypothetical protein [Enterococcus hulanensis]|uniref:hypothetical protein n=1 Tax=Enterococcus hulanensis TaxID=2559929 RepID=UPI001F5DC0BF|nr:hypothetical protein [Enterococcus hulanensis]
MNDAKSKETGNIFEGLSFKYPPVSKEEYEQAYEEYVKRCSDRQIKIHQGNSKCGSSIEAKNITEAKEIVKELINVETVSITINQKERDKGQPVTANGDKFSDVNNHYR